MKKYDEKQIYKGRYYNYSIKKIHCNPEEAYDYECITLATPTSKGGVEVIAFLKKDGIKYVLINENYRYAIDSWVIEFPGGMIDLNESIREAGLRELKEETGYTANKVLREMESSFVDPWKSNDVNLLEISPTYSRDRWRE